MNLEFLCSYDYTSKVNNTNLILLILLFFTLFHTLNLH